MMNQQKNFGERGPSYLLDSYAFCLTPQAIFEHEASEPPTQSWHSIISA